LALSHVEGEQGAEAEAGHVAAERRSSPSESMPQTRPSQAHFSHQALNVFDFPRAGDGDRRLIKSREEASRAFDKTHQAILSDPIWG
jgi:hypothetical protein